MAFNDIRIYLDKIDALKDKDNIARNQHMIHMKDNNNQLREPKLT